LKGGRRDLFEKEKVSRSSVSATQKIVANKEKRGERNFRQGEQREKWGERRGRLDGYHEVGPKNIKKKGRREKGGGNGERPKQAAYELH